MGRSPAATAPFSVTGFIIVVSRIDPAPAAETPRKLAGLYE